MQLIERRIILISNIFVLGSEKNQLFGHCKERYVLTKSSSVFLFLWISFQHTQVKRFPPRMVEWCNWQSWNSVLGMFPGNQKGIPLIILAAKFLILREGNRNSVPSRESNLGTLSSRNSSFNYKFEMPMSIQRFAIAKHEQGIREKLCFPP